VSLRTLKILLVVSVMIFVLSSTMLVIEISAISKEEFYYNDVEKALYDLNNDCLGINSNYVSNKNILKIIDGKQKKLILLKNIELDCTMKLIDTDLDLNGYEISSKISNPIIIASMTTIFGEKPGSSITGRSDKNTNLTNLCQPSPPPQSQIGGGLRLAFIL
jgi:hypothetical protein